MPEDAPLHAIRPWGSWQVLDRGEGYKVKRIVVHPGHRLSYQTHEQRSEHWLVVSGRATCVLHGQALAVGPGEHVDVERGTPHRICNDGTEELVVIEIQRGDYTEEDDIVRLDDDYDRCEAP